MARIDDLLRQALEQERPPADAGREVKKGFSEKISARAALALADELRHRGMKEVMPGLPGESGSSGAERRMSGGLGAKKVDVTWATGESGLLFSISIKNIGFRDERSGNFQKNLTNRRGDMIAEAMTLHRRFPYAVVVGVFFFPKEAAADQTELRNSTFVNANIKFRVFTDRDDTHGSDEKFERFYIALVDWDQSPPLPTFYKVAEPEAQQVELSAVLDECVRLVAERNSDFYEFHEGQIRKA